MWFIWEYSYRFVSLTKGKNWKLETAWFSPKGSTYKAHMATLTTMLILPIKLTAYPT